MLSTNAQGKAAVKNLQHWKQELRNNGWEDGNLGAADGFEVHKSWSTVSAEMK